MAKSDNARTHDWIGARVVDRSAAESGESPGAAARDAFTFHVWKCSTDRRLYLVTATETIPDSAPSCPDGAWRFVKSVWEEGRPRVGFSEVDAKRDIQKQGFHTVRVDVQTTVRASDDADEG